MWSNKLFIVINCIPMILGAGCSRDYPRLESPIMFPLGIGNRWTLSCVRKFIPEDMGLQSDTTLYKYELNWQIMGRDVIAGHPAFVLYGEITRGRSFRRSSITWYTEEWQATPGLYRIAQYTQGIGDIPIPKCMFNGCKVKACGREFNSVDEFVLWVNGCYTKFDTVLIIPPYKVLEYPLTVGKEWIVHKTSLSTRRVVAYERVTLPAGTFFCYRVEIVVEVVPDLIFYEWFANVGLVKHYLDVPILIVTPWGDSHRYRFVEIWELIDYEIKGE